MPDVVLRPPWDAFLADVDAAFEAPFELHCLGGFVIAQLHDFERVTVDVDIIEVRGADVRAVAATAGKGSRLHRRHDVYMDVVTVAAVPDGYEERLIDLASATFKYLRLRARSMSRSSTSPPQRSNIFDSERSNRTILSWRS